MTSQSSEAQVRRLLEALEADQPVARADAAGEIRDYLPSLEDRLAGDKLLQGLLVRGLQEPDPTAREAIFHALGELCSRFEFHIDQFRLLIKRIDSIDPYSLEYALYALASTHDSAVRPILDGFAGHQNVVVRESAAEALAELGIDSH